MPVTTPQNPAGANGPEPFTLAQLAPPSRPVNARRRRWPRIVAIAAAAAVVAGGGLTVYTLVAGDKPLPFVGGSLTVTGSLTLLDRDGYALDETNGRCEGRRGYGDIHGGTQVAITDASGIVVAVGQLAAGMFGGGGCQFSFNVPDVPRGKGFYGIQIDGTDRRGVMRFQESEISGGGLKLTLGG